MANSSPTTLIRRGYAAFNAADIATLKEVIAPDAVQKVPGSNTMSGEYKGRDAILGFYATTAQETAGTFQAPLEEMFDDTVGGVAALHHATAHRAGRTLDQRAAIVFQVVNDRAEELLGLSADLTAENEFWGGSALPPNTDLEIVGQTYAAIANGDADALTRLIAKDVTAFMGGQNHYTGTHRGRDTFFRLFAEAADETDSTFQIALETLFSDGAGHVLAIQRETATKDGKHHDVRHANLIQVLNSTIVDIHDFSADPAADDAFWG